MQVFEALLVLADAAAKLSLLESQPRIQKGATCEAYWHSVLIFLGVILLPLLLGSSRAFGPPGETQKNDFSIFLMLIEK